MLQGCEFQLTECPLTTINLSFSFNFRPPHWERVLNCCCFLKQREYIYSFTNRSFLFVYCTKCIFSLPSSHSKRHISKENSTKWNVVTLQCRIIYVLWFKINQQYWETVLHFYTCYPINIFFIKIIKVLFILKDAACLCECSFCLALPASL